MTAPYLSVNSDDFRVSISFSTQKKDCNKNDTDMNYYNVTGEYTKAMQVEKKEIVLRTSIGSSY